MKKAIIVGGGMCGCTAAYLLAKDRWKVSLFEANDYLGGGCRTFLYGGHPYTMGPRPIYTEYEEVYHFLNKFVPMQRFKLNLWTYVARDGEFYTYPIHKEDIPLMPDRETIEKELSKRPQVEKGMNFEEYYQASLGPTLYSKFIDLYSKKMWSVQSNTELTDFSWSLKGVPLKEGEKNVRDDLIHAHPSEKEGYNQYFDSIFDMVDVHLNANVREFDVAKRRIKVRDEWISGDILVSTTSVDMLMNYTFGKLKYIGREFFPIVLPTEKIIPDPVLYLYYAGDEPYTRIVEYKKLYRYESPYTLIGIEIPSFKNKLYPYPIKSEREKAQKYLDALPDFIFSMGRMGRYKYDNIGQVIMQGYELIEKLQ